MISLYPACLVSYKESAHLNLFHVMCTAAQMTFYLLSGSCVAGDSSSGQSSGGWESPDILTPSKSRSQVHSHSDSLEGSALGGDCAGGGFCFGQGSVVDFLWFRASHLWPH